VTSGCRSGSQRQRSAGGATRSTRWPTAGAVTRTVGSVLPLAGASPVSGCKELLAVGGGPAEPKRLLVDATKGWWRQTRELPSDGAYSYTLNLFDGDQPGTKARASPDNLEASWHHSVDVFSPSLALCSW